MKQRNGLTGASGSSVGKNAESCTCDRLNSLPLSKLSNSFAEKGQENRNLRHELSSVA